MSKLRFLKRARRFFRSFSRTEWMAKKLGLEKIRDGKNKPGLVLIQVDGFSHHEFQKALKAGEMPHLKKRFKRNHYSVHPMYSGLPSNTPAVQAELFYGVRSAVPAFSFFDHKCGRLCKMVESESAKAIEAELISQGEPLLQGGSSYSNIYTGGAREPRFCAASMGWGTVTKAPGTGTLILIGILHWYAFIRAIAFGVLEFFLAIYDFVKGIIAGERPQQELKFIFTRIAVCIFLREWVTAGAKMDLSRGLPIVHLNLIGYDEQAHRRGPESLFAHWVLKGIDESIHRIWKAAESSDARKYEVWIYSDHGQIKADPYEKIFGKTLNAQVAAWTQLDPIIPKPSPILKGEMQSERFKFLGGARFQKLFSTSHGGLHASKAETHFPIVSDLGPVALIYLGEHELKLRLRLGMQLALEGGVPIVLDAKSSPILTGWTSAGPFNWPQDAESLVGNHPFLSELIPDLERLCMHKNAGDLVLLGWKRGMKNTITFTMENGSHGGISPLECTPFVALPKTRERIAQTPGVIRPQKLRDEAMTYMSESSAAIGAHV